MLLCTLPWQASAVVTVASNQGSGWVKAQVPHHVEHREEIVETSTRPCRYVELPCKTWSLRSPDPSGSRVRGLSGMLVPVGIPWNEWFGWNFGSEICRLAPGVSCP